MSVARVTEITARSPEGFDAATKAGLERAAKTLRGVQHAYIKDQEVYLDNGTVKEYQVTLKITFMLEG
jgi:flavin-binding protein dodecin